MSAKILLTTFLILFSSLSSTGVVGNQAMAGRVLPDQVEAQLFDPQAQVLADYLKKHNSPLQYHAQDFIDAARIYSLDWRLVPAIAGVESTFGKAIPGGYNAWGWGVYGNQAIYFRSWKEGIFVISEGLKKGYLDKGLKDPYSINRVYAASPYWGGKVSYFMKDLERFSDDHSLAVTGRMEVTIPPAKVAAASGLLI